MEKIDQIKKVTTKNILFLSLRQFGMQAISTLGFFILTILLGTAEVGLFAIVSESIGLLGYFSDIGLASALIQQKKPISRRQLRSTFFIQQIVVLIGILIAVFSFRHFSIQKDYGQTETWIFISLVFSFFLASLKTIPSVLLERKLNFKVISLVDIVENLTFYLVAVIFAALGFGAFSYVYAVFARSLLGLVLMYSLKPWPIGLDLDWPSLKSLFKFGIPFQLNSFIAMAKDRLVNLVVAGIIGRQPFAYLSWAQKTTRLPLSLMDALMKVSFPTFSRLQHHPEYLKKSIERSTFYISFFIFPALAGLSFTAPDFINLIPKYQKWLPALIPVYLYSANAAIAAVTTPLTNAFNAIGKITLTTKFMLMWTGLTWLFFPYLSSRYGFQGTAFANLVVGLSSFLVWRTANSLFQVNILKIILLPLFGTITMMLSLFLINLLNLSPPTALLSKILAGFSVYALFHLIFSKHHLSWLLAQIKSIKT